MERRRGFNWFAVVMFMICAYFGTVLITQQLHLSQVSESQRLADKRLASAKTENENLRKELEELQNLDNIEKIAREDLGLAKDGELPYQVAH